MPSRSDGYTCEYAANTVRSESLNDLREVSFLFLVHGLMISRPLYHCGFLCRQAASRRWMARHRKFCVITQDTPYEVGVSRRITNSLWGDNLASGYRHEDQEFNSVCVGRHNTHPYSDGFKSTEIFIETTWQIEPGYECLLPEHIDA